MPRSSRAALAALALALTGCGDTEVTSTVETSPAERHGPDCAVALIKQATAIGFGERLADDIEAEPDFFDDMAAALEALDDTIVEDWLERIADWQERLEEFRVRRAIAVARMMRADDCNADQEAFALRLADRSDTLGSFPGVGTRTLVDPLRARANRGGHSCVHPVQEHMSSPICAPSKAAHWSAPRQRLQINGAELIMAAERRGDPWRWRYTT